MPAAAHGSFGEKRSQTGLVPNDPPDVQRKSVTLPGRPGILPQRRGRMSKANSSVPDSRFIEALTRYQPVLAAFCHAQLANRADAGDVLQETNLKLWEKSATWDPETSFLPWAYTVARYTILSHVRDRMREKLVFDSDVVELMGADCESAASDLPVRQEALGQCLQRLDASQRALLRDHYVGGRSLRDLASAQGRTEGSLKMLMMRLRQQLGSCIDRNLKQVCA